MTYLALIVIPLIFAVGAVIGPVARLSVKESLIHGQEQLRAHAMQTIREFAHDGGLTAVPLSLARKMAAVILRWSAERLDQPAN